LCLAFSKIASFESTPDGFEVEAVLFEPIGVSFGFLTVGAKPLYSH